MIRIERESIMTIRCRTNADNRSRNRGTALLAAVAVVAVLGAGCGLEDVDLGAHDDGGGSADAGADALPGADQGITSCTPNEAVCVDPTHYKTCNSGGTGYAAPQACPAHHRCDKGTCVMGNEVLGTVFVHMTMHWDTTPPPAAKLNYSPVFKATFVKDAPCSAVTGCKKPTLPTIAPDTCQVLNSTTVPGTYLGKPFDAGPIAVSGLPSGAATLVHNPVITEGTAYDLTPQLTAADFPYGKTLTLAGQGGGEVEEAISATIDVPPKRMLTQPSHFDQLSRSQPLNVAWTGATGKGTVTITVIGSAKYTLICAARDDGAFTIPASKLTAAVDAPGSGSTAPAHFWLEEQHLLEKPLKGLTRDLTLRSTVRYRMQIQFK